jgi:hypothetical protein
MLSLLIPSSNSHIPLQASIDSVNLTSIILEHHVIMIFLLALVMKTTVTHQLTDTADSREVALQLMQ